MTIDLTPNLERRVRERVDRGQYETVEALIAAAVERLLDEDDIESESTQAAISRAVAQSGRNEGRPAEKVFADFRLRHDLPKLVSVPVDEDLLAEAQQLDPDRSQAEIVQKALEEYIRYHKQLQVLELSGTIDIDPDYDYKRER